MKDLLLGYIFGREWVGNEGLDQGYCNGINTDLINAAHVLVHHDVRPFVWKANELNQES